MPRKIITITAILLTMVFAVQIAVAGTLIERFRSDSEFSNGTVVSSKQDDLEAVEPASLNNLDRIAGVVSAETDALFQVRGDGRNLDIVKSGVVDILVSNENGTIAEGDTLSIATVAGVAAREAGQSHVIGIALETFDGTNEPVAEVELESPKRTIRIGRIQAQIEPQTNPDAGGVGFSPPQFLQDFANKVTGRNIEPARVLASFISLIMTVLVSAVLLFTLASSTAESKQRNPISTGSLKKSEHQLVIVILSILALGTGFSFLIIWL